MKISVRNIVYMSLLIALTIILTRITSIHLVFGGVEYARIGFGAFPVIFGSILLGPKYGLIIGALGDVIGYHLNPMGPYLPHFTLIAALNGLLPGLLFKLLRYKTDLGRFILIIVITQILCSALLTPYTLWALFKIPLIVTMPQRLITLLITVPAFAYLSRVLYIRLSCILNLQPPQTQYVRRKVSA